MKLFANDFVKFYEELDAASILVENNFEVHSKDELDQENISNSQLTVEEQSEESTSIIDNTDNTVESVLKYLANVTNTDQISYKDLTLLFELYLKDQIKEGHKDLARTVWRNIRKVALQKKDPYGRGMYKALQYYYNAYLTEETAKAAIPELFYITGEEEHSTLHPDSRSTDAPDLAGNFLFGHSCKIEVKTYKDQASWTQYCLNEDNRKDFHNADFVLSYLINTKTWYLSLNAVSTWKLKLDLPVVANLVNIEVKLGRVSITYFK